MARRTDRGRLLDIALIVLAFASVLLFTVDVGARLASVDRMLLRVADLAIVAVYASIFFAKGFLDERPGRWFARHSWLAFALLPVTIPILVATPFFLVIQVFVLMLRIAKAIDRALHIHVVAGLSERYRTRVVEELTQPLLMDLARILEDAVTSQDYAAAMGERLRARQPMIEAAVRRGIESSPRLSKLAHFGPVQRAIDETTREIVEAAHTTLTGPELNLVIKEAFHDAFGRLRVGIAEPKWPHRGIGMKEAAHRVVEEIRHPGAARATAAALPP